MPAVSWMGKSEEILNPLKEIQILSEGLFNDLFWHCHRSFKDAYTMSQSKGRLFYYRPGKQMISYSTFIAGGWHRGWTTSFSYYFLYHLGIMGLKNTEQNIIFHEAPWKRGLSTAEILVCCTPRWFPTNQTCLRQKYSSISASSQCQISDPSTGKRIFYASTTL